MRDILIILGSFAAGLLLALFGVIPDTLDISQISKYVLYLLMFLVGVNLGKDEAFHAFFAVGHNGRNICRSGGRLRCNPVFVEIECDA